MSQSFTDDCFAGGHSAQTDMQNIENNFAALKSMFYGASAPPNTIAGMGWFDAAKKLPKIRNNANAAWLGIMAADAAHKIWVYRNSAPDGWAIDASVTDVVLALKGGSCAYNASGGTMAGTWTQPDCTLATSQIPPHSHPVGMLGISINAGSGKGTLIGVKLADGLSSLTWVDASSYFRTNAGGTGDTGGGGPHNHGSTHRPAAAVGTLQYMDI